MISKCESCLNYEQDDYSGEFYCAVSLDEDEMLLFLTDKFESCPYYSGNDEYEIVRKQN